MEELMTVDSEEIIDEGALISTTFGKEAQESIGLDGDSKTEKLVKFPLTRIKTLVKMDPDVHLCSQEALFLITKATELFVECITKESYTFTAQSKKKTVQKRDIEQSIETVDGLAFLEGVME